MPRGLWVPSAGRCASASSPFARTGGAFEITWVYEFCVEFVLGGGCGFLDSFRAYFVYRARQTDISMMLVSI